MENLQLKGCDLVEKEGLINEWFAVLKTEELKEEPKQVYVLGVRIVVFRNESGVYAFLDLCIHRGSVLSLGKVRDGNLVCPYHAWEYNSEGVCVRIPSLPCHRAIPLKARTKVFQCKEEYGLIWVCIGNEPKQFINYEDFGLPRTKTIVYGPYEVKANAPRVMENFLDVAHLMFVHEGILGDPNYSEIKDFDVHFMDGKLVTDKISIFQPIGIMDYTEYVYTVTSPVVARIDKFFPNTENHSSLMIFTLQESEEKTKVYMLSTRNYDLNKRTSDSIEQQNYIFSQDLPIVENQKPELLPLDLQAELHLKSDRLSIAYRKWLKELGVKVGTA